MAAFVDRVTVHVAAGNGGHGVSSVHREKYKPLGGPDGGQRRRRRRHRPRGRPQRAHAAGLPPPPAPEGRQRQARRGQQPARRQGRGQGPARARGHGRQHAGRRGDRRPRRRRHPRRPRQGRQGRPRQRRAGQLPPQGARLRAARRARRGASTPSSSSRASPTSAWSGFPSAGKSSLVAAMSAARPKIADYPFTTLVPNLGVVRSGDTIYTMADVPGLIPGASTGKGLGVQFLRHVERCAVLVHVVDMATMEPGRDPETRHRGARARARRVRRRRARPGRPAADRRPQQDRRPGRPRARRPGAHLAGEARPRRLPGQRRHRRGADRVRLRARRRRRGAPREPAADGAGPGHDRARRPSTTPVSPSSATPSIRTAFVVRGVRPERWVRQTDFSNDEAVGFLADRLNRLGVEEELAKAGRRSRATRSPSAGSPSTGCRRCRPARSPSRSPRAWAAAAPTAGIDAPHRVRAEERLAAKKARRVPYELSDETWTDDDLPDDARVTRPRREIAGARRVVVKVGSSSLTTLPGGLDAARGCRPWSTCWARCGPPGREVVLVSSGAIAAGLAPLGVAGRPRDLATAQAAASVGQMRLVETYDDAFAGTTSRRAGAAHARRPRGPAPLPERPPHAAHGSSTSASCRS